MGYDNSQIVKFITRNENWDISREEDADFVYFYLHGTNHIHYDDILVLTRHTAFAGIDLRDNCLCIKLLIANL